MFIESKRAFGTGARLDLKGAWQPSCSLDMNLHLLRQPLPILHPQPF